MRTSDRVCRWSARYASRWSARYASQRLLWSACGLSAAGVLLALMGGAQVAGACGACLEDRMAAVYDHAVVGSARARGHWVVFAAIAGARTPWSTAQGARVRRALVGCTGVQAGSIRLAPAAAAASFAFDPRGTSLAGLLARIRRDLASDALGLDTLRVLRAPPAPPRPRVGA